MIGQIQAVSIPESSLSSQQQRVNQDAERFAVRHRHSAKPLHAGNKAEPSIHTTTTMKRLQVGNAAAKVIPVNRLSVDIEKRYPVRLRPVATEDGHAVALRTVNALRQQCPHLPVIARARDLQTSSDLIDAGAIHAYPETIESSLLLGATALRMLQIPTIDIDQMLQDIRDGAYLQVIETPTKESAPRQAPRRFSSPPIFPRQLAMPSSVPFIWLPALKAN